MIAPHREDPQGVIALHREGPRRDCAPLGALRRLLTLASAWTLIVLGGPGILAPGGLWILAVAGFALWGTAAHRPGPRAFWIEWGTAALAWAVVCGWAWYVWPGALLYIGPGLGLYSAASGALLRRLARHAPLALAAPAAWVALETLRAVIEPPLGFPWMRLGTHWHASEWVAGGARLFGVGGLSWVFAALGGLIADLALRRRSEPRRLLTPLPWSLAWGLGPLVAACSAALAFPAPATRDGPRVLLVQPGIEQARKLEPPSATELFRTSRELTAEGLAHARAALEPEPDLVAWSETILGIPIVARELAGDLRAGARSEPWARFPLQPEDAERLLDLEENWIGAGLFGEQSGVLPQGSSFVCGTEYLFARDGKVRRWNAVFLWNAAARRSAPAGKLHLVPSAETMLGLERFRWVRESILALANYVPDIEPADEVAVLAFTARDGREYRFSATVCFDNAFDDPYASAVRTGPLDFHFVASNEAWYRESWEVDQMLAFSHLIAIETGRSVVRATNSGISAVVAPDGSEVARLVVGGRDREVRGTLRATVPVPIEPARRTPFAASEHLWIAVWLAAPLVLLGCARLRRRPPARGNLDSPE